MQIVAVGEILWDVFAAGELLGGAPLNFSAAAQRLGDSVALLTAVGRDERGNAALRRMAALGLATDFVQVSEERNTGTAVVTVDTSGNASYVIERPAAFDDCHLDEGLLARLAAIHPEWLYLGTLAQTQALNEANLNLLLASLPGVRCFYDMNLREGHWNLALVHRLSELATVMKLNETEAETLFQLTCPGAEYSLERFCRLWSSSYHVETICVTLGSEGCAIFASETLSHHSGFAVEVADTVGAGDSFAAAFLHTYSRGWPIARQASFANALGALVASRAGATPDWTVEECLSLIEQNESPLSASEQGV
jgi:fructokinase